MVQAESGGRPARGLGTLFSAPHGFVRDLAPRMVGVLGVPFDLSSTGLVGARFGAAACREASAYYAVFGQEFEEITTRRLLRVPPVIDLGDASVLPHDWDTTAENLRREVANVTRTGARPVVIGGDHYVTHALVRGFREGLAEGGQARIGYIQFSSQLDLGAEDPAWGSVWRGATARRIIDAGTVDAANMVWVGTNGYVRAEQWDFAQELNLNLLTLNDVRRDGIAETTRKAIEVASTGCDALYVSIDLDVLDGGYVPTTDTPRFRGLTDVELLAAADILGDAGAGALDVTGLNPAIESEAITGARFTAWLILRFISQQTPLPLTEEVNTP